MNLQNPLLHISGVNSTFHGRDGTFQDYIQHMQNVISAAHIGLKTKNLTQVVFANSPFELRPDKPTRKGILLVHGLYDSPFTCQEMAQHFCAQGFLVRAILLPGQGTVPGDLLTIGYQEWLKATEFGLQTLARTVDEIYILGFSLGGALSLYTALKSTLPIKALLLLAPALKPKRNFANLLINFHRFTGLFLPAQRWYQLLPQTTYTRYESFTVNAVRQVCLLMKDIRQLLQQQTLSMPIFTVVTEDDESISPEATIAFFNQQPNPLNRLLIYSSQPKTTLSDPKVISRNSAYPEKSIVDFAHTALPTSPSNKHYGEKGDFRDFQHYAYNPKKYSRGSIYFGSIMKKNLKKYTIQRLSYNPDFSGMMELIDNFLVSVEKKK